MTFDDGPSSADRLAILFDHLDTYNITAIFFVNGAAWNLDALVQSMVDRGHMVGWHSRWHPYLHCATDATILADLDFGDKLLNRSGVPYRLYRPPYGEITKRQMDLYASKGFDVIHWDVDSIDWEKPNSASVIAEAVEHCTSTANCTQMRCAAAPCPHDEGHRVCDQTNTVSCQEALTPDHPLVWLSHEYDWNLPADLVFAKFKALGFSFGDPKGCVRSGSWDFARCRGNGLGGWLESC